MGFLRREGKARRSGGPWMPTTRETAPNAEQEADLAGDDLAELLAATNAKRRARGKRELSASDVELRLWSEEQDVRSRRAEQTGSD